MLPVIMKEELTHFIVEVICDIFSNVDHLSSLFQISFICRWNRHYKRWTNFIFFYFWCTKNLSSTTTKGYLFFNCSHRFHDRTNFTFVCRVGFGWSLSNSKDANYITYWLAKVVEYAMFAYKIWKYVYLNNIWAMRVSKQLFVESRVLLAHDAYALSNCHSVRTLFRLSSTLIWNCALAYSHRFWMNLADVSLMCHFLKYEI